MLDLLLAQPQWLHRFGSLEFADVEGPTLVNGLLPSQALRFGDLDFIADHLG
jgi:hypothetical protein